MAIKRRFYLKLALVLVILTCAFMMISEDVHGVSVPYSAGLVNDTDGVNIRASYSTDSSIVGCAPYQGAVLITKERFTSSTSTSKSTRWYYVQSSYGNGWIRSDFLDVSYGDIKGKIKSTVNIRKGAGTSFDIVTSLNEGDMVDIKMITYSSSGAKWYKIYYNKYYRFVSGTYVDLVEETEGEVDSIPIENSSFEQELAAFPSSYHKALKALHEKYPSWHFKANVVDYTWDDALAKMMTKPGTNTIPSSKPDSYKAVSKETYNFDKKTYYSFDGSSWLAASKKAVAYYMDPRNWLDEISIFMFESLSFDPTSQTEAMVKELLASTAIPKEYSASYMAAATAYNISPVYLAAKTKLELGSSAFMVDGHQFTYNGKTYKGYYNTYNIGASDSASGSAALKGLYYAASGTTYLRPWNTLDKAIRGGAKFIAEDFVGNNQHTAYYEHFNVANGLSEVGTHVYMTNTMAAATHANITYWDYCDNGMLNTAFTFEIPVYQEMTSSAAPMPGNGNNNCYLDTLTVYNGSTKIGFTTAFDRFTSTHILKTGVGAEVNELTVNAVANASDAKITITGNTGLKIGENQIKVKVTSSAGIVKTYKIVVNKFPESTVVVAPTITTSCDAETGKPVVSWAQAINADEYAVYRSTSKTGTYELLSKTTTLSYLDTSAIAGTLYYYQVKSIGKTDIIGEATSTAKYRTCDLPRPVVSSSNTIEEGYPQLSWSPIDGAVKYAIYRSDGEAGTYSKIAEVTETTYTDAQECSAGVTSYYKVKALHSNTEAHSAYSLVTPVIRDLSQPIVSVGNDSERGKPMMTWNPVDGALHYEIHRGDSDQGPFTVLMGTKETTFVDSSAISGKSYYYQVKAIHSNPDANSALSQLHLVECLYEPLLVTATTQAVDGKPQLSWNPLFGAEKYEVYRSDSENGKYIKMKTLTEAIYVNKTAKLGQNYYYKVKAIGQVSEDGSPIFSEIVSATCVLPQPVVTVSNRLTDGKVKLSWTPVEGASKYTVYYSSTKNGKYKTLISKTSTSHVHKKSVAGTKYYYKVKAVYGENTSLNSALSEIKYRVCDLPRPVISVSLNTSNGKPKVTWDKVEGANNYVVYYSTSKSGTYKKLSTKTGTVCTHTKAKAGTKYYYKVKAVYKANSNANSAYSLVKSKTSK